MSAETEFLLESLSEIRETYGQWTAHNIHIGNDIYTMGGDYPSRVQVRADLYAELIYLMVKERTFSTLRILDLGCLEGGVSIHLSEKGASCVGVDVRENHLAKARFASDCLGLQDRCDWINADVLDDNFWNTIGMFDVVICSGLLYHIDAKSIMPLLSNIRSCCSGLAIFDTNIAHVGTERYRHGDLIELWGHYWHEHEANTSLEQRLQASWSSLKNDQAFWLTERSLCNALSVSGFGYVMKPMHPYHEWSHKNRDVWIAVPQANQLPGVGLREEPDNRSFLS